MTCNRFVLLVTLAATLLLGAVLSTGCDARGTSNEAAAKVSAEFLNALAQGDQQTLDRIGMPPVDIAQRREAAFGGQSVSDLKIDRFRMRKWTDIKFGQYSFLAQVRISAVVDGKSITRDLLVAGTKFPDGRMQVADAVEQSRD